jgi:hypothetical protein
MATVPGPDPDQPLPRPGAPGVEPAYEPEEESFSPEEDRPEWLTEPYDPSREYAEPELPAGVP